MERRIVISSQINQTIVGVVEDGHLAEFFLERDNERKTVGNIYKGRVENVLPGIEAAFLDLGLEKNAFLHVADIVKDGAPIEEVVRRGDSLLVQVTKEPVGSKGARVSTSIAVPGRSLVLLPFENTLGVSRKITEGKERERLRELAAKMKPDNRGIIVRTVAEGHQEGDLQADLHYLQSLWDQILEKTKKRAAPCEIYRDHDLVYRIIRDVVGEDVKEILVDQVALHRKIESIIFEFGLAERCRVELYKGKVGLFEFFGLNRELERALKNRVWLSSGGYLVIDETEALVSIDVNTGKYTGTRFLRETVLKTNLEAASEIARQLRLRNIGGIIIVDFIDMDTEEDKEKVLRLLEKSLAKDKTKAHVLGFTRLGLVEITRKKAKKKLTEMLQTPCPSCEGTGHVPSDETLALQIANEVYSLAQEEEVEAIFVQCHPAVASFLIGNAGGNLESLEKTTGKKIYVRGQDRYVRSEREIHSGSSQVIEKRACPVHVGQILRVKVEGIHNHNPDHGIARVEGFVLDLLGASLHVGEFVDVEILSKEKTFAIARIVDAT